jgi:anti-sigma regulatory factor (Ser/Thr protein kinase)/Na+-translocating ferredoxin:NAD+ oxidoreductase RNF subunit RnfB
MNAVSYSIRGGDYEHGGSASRSVKEQLKKVGADPAVVRRAMIAAYEAEMNVVIHSHGGELRAALQNGQLDVEVIDKGPGIPDIDKAMRAGFSTAPPSARELGFGAGMGLPNIKKNSDRFAIDSAVGRGTRISFTILLRPQALYGAGRHSVRITPNKCRQSFRCLTACPTQAVRVLHGKPEILDYLCVDCTACIAACPSSALDMAGTTETLTAAADTVLVLPAESLVQFGAGISPERVLDELMALGFREVWLTAGWEAALRTAVTEYARHEAHVRPVISPACPAVVNWIETRFPSLIPHLAPFLSAFEAVRAELSGKPAIFVASCPCERTTVLANANLPQPEVALPATLRATVLPRLAGADTSPGCKPGGFCTAQRPVEPVATTPSCDSSAPLRVTGVRHVANVLESIENGLAGDVDVIEPWICDEGCFGSPLLADEPFLARLRWSPPPQVPAEPARAVRRSVPFAPRKGLRLDDDMARAIQKLGKIDRLVRTLPGSNCGVCGAPTCAALAEDIVLGRAIPDACPRQRPTANAQSDQEKAT